MTTILCKHCYRPLPNFWTRCPHCGTRTRSIDPRPTVWAAAALLTAYYVTLQPPI